MKRREQRYKAHWNQRTNERKEKVEWHCSSSSFPHEKKEDFSLVVVVVVVVVVGRQWPQSVRLYFFNTPCFPRREKQTRESKQQNSVVVSRVVKLLRPFSLGSAREPVDSRFTEKALDQRVSCFVNRLTLHPWDSGATRRLTQPKNGGGDREERRGLREPRDETWVRIGRRYLLHAISSPLLAIQTEEHAIYS